MCIGLVVKADQCIEIRANEALNCKRCRDNYTIGCLTHEICSTCHYEMETVFKDTGFGDEIKLKEFIEVYQLTEGLEECG